MVKVLGEREGGLHKDRVEETDNKTDRHEQNRHDGTYAIHDCI